MGKEGQTVPEMSNDWVDTISKRYIELYEQVIGSPFTPEPFSQEETYNRIIENLQSLKLT
jgi:phosphoribosylaminoimidazole-succinocarboxamide synthase